MLFVHFGQQLIETAGFQVVLDLLVPHLVVIVLKPSHQFGDLLGWQLGYGRFDFRDAHIPP